MNPLRIVAAVIVALLFQFGQPVSANAAPAALPTTQAPAQTDGICEVFPFLPGC